VEAREAGRHRASLSFWLCKRTRVLIVTSSKGDWEFVRQWRFGIKIGLGERHDVQRQVDGELRIACREVRPDQALMHSGMSTPFWPW
jgi:hypothetical protein